MTGDKTLGDSCRAADKLVGMRRLYETTTNNFLQLLELSEGYNFELHLTKTFVGHNVFKGKKKKSVCSQIIITRKRRRKRRKDEEKKSSYLLLFFQLNWIPKRCHIERPTP